MAVQPLRRSSFVQKLDSSAEFSQLLQYDRDAIVCFFDDKAESSRLEALINQLAEKYNGTTFVEVDMDRLQQLAQQYNVTKAPTLLAMAGGQEVQRVEGANEQQITQLLEQKGKLREERRRGLDATKKAPTQRKPMLARENNRSATAGDINQQQQQLRQKPHMMIGSMPLFRQCDALDESSQRQERLQRRREVRARQQQRGAAGAQLQQGAQSKEAWFVTLERARTDSEFAKMLLEAQDAIVFFISRDDECGKQLSLTINELGQKYAGATLIMVDARKLKGIAQQYKISKTPAVLSFRGANKEGELLECANLHKATFNERLTENLGNMFRNVTRFMGGARRKLSAKKQQVLGARAGERRDFKYGTLAGRRQHGWRLDSSPANKQQQQQ